MSNSNIIFNDSSKKEHDLWPDLVNNEFLFNEYYSNKKVDVTQSWPDDSDYSFYPHIDDIAEDIINNPGKYSDITVRVPSEYVYSSAKQLGGFDRVLDVYNNGGPEKATESLKIKTTHGKERGFISADCPTMNGYVRWTYDDLGYICGFTIAKNMGNHRFILKKRANGGKSTELLIKLHFHPVDISESYENIIRRESDAHHTDAQNQQGQTEEQKAYSGYKSGRIEYKQLMNFLKEVQVDYAGILKQENLLDNPDQTPTLSSISQMNAGINGGLFKKLGIYNVKTALEIAKEIALDPKQKDSQLVITHSSIVCIANLYKYFTEEYDGKDAIFTRPQLREFLLYKFTGDQGKWKKVMKLNDLNQTGGQKDANVTNAIKFLPELKEYYMEETRTKTGEKRKYCFGMENPAIKNFLNSISDPLQRKYAISESGLMY